MEVIEHVGAEFISQISCLSVFAHTKLRTAFHLLLKLIWVLRICKSSIRHFNSCGLAVVSTA